MWSILSQIASSKYGYVTSIASTHVHDDSEMIFITTALDIIMPGNDSDGRSCELRTRVSVAINEDHC